MVRTYFVSLLIYVRNFGPSFENRVKKWKLMMMSESIKIFESVFNQVAKAKL